MLSDEEKKAMKLLNDMIKHKPDTIRLEWRKGIYALQLVLNLIEKQSKEIERLEARKYMFNAETGEISQIPINNNYISKDKIKAKIEEYKKKIEKMEKDDVGIGFTLEKEWSDLKAKVEFGQSLLEKE